MSVLISDSFKIRENISDEWENIQFSINSPGVPTGGSTGQVLTKNSTVDYDTAWVNPPDLSSYVSHSEIDTLFTNYLKTIYPVGSIYMSVNSTSPATLFGGTWERITGRFLLAATDNGVNGGNSSASVKPGYTGGEATSTLEVANLPGHTHTVYGFKGDTTNDTRNRLVMQNDGNLVVYQSNGTAKWNAGSGQTSTSVAYKGWTAGENGTTSSTGSKTSFNNMPPYLAVYVWKRLS